MVDLNKLKTLLNKGQRQHNILQDSKKKKKKKNVREKKLFNHNL